MNSTCSVLVLGVGVWLVNSERRKWKTSAAEAGDGETVRGQV